jgi:hypothetical protein
VVVLPEVHHALLKVLFTDLIYGVETFDDPIVDSKVSKSRQSRKRDTNTLTIEVKINKLTANNLTWPKCWLKGIRSERINL